MLSFLGHLHTGNIVVEESRVKLLDTENWLLGLPSYYRCYFTQLKKVNVSNLMQYFTCASYETLKLY